MPSSFFHYALFTIILLVVLNQDHNFILVFLKSCTLFIKKM